MERKNQELERMLEFTMALTNYTRNMIFAFSKSDGSLVFQNQPAEWFSKVYPERVKEIKKSLLTYHEDEAQETEKWNLSVGVEAEATFFEVESFEVQWGTEPVQVHIVGDDTVRKRKEALFYSLAYVDPLTNLNNRRYALDLMQSWMDEGTAFLFTFIDVDNLKFCNDTLGHEAGDRYLITVVDALKLLPGVLCRAGGDEFFFMLPGNNVEKRQEDLFRIREFLRHQPGSTHPKDFSYATIAIPAHPEKALTEYIKQADLEMYQCKMKHKKRNVEIPYRDEQI